MQPGASLLIQNKNKVPQIAGLVIEQLNHQHKIFNHVIKYRNEIIHIFQKTFEPYALNR